MMKKLRIIASASALLLALWAFPAATYAAGQQDLLQTGSTITLNRRGGGRGGCHNNCEKDENGRCVNCTAPIPPRDGSGNGQNQGGGRGRSGGRGQGSHHTNCEKDENGRCVNCTAPVPPRDGSGNGQNQGGGRGRSGGGGQGKGLGPGQEKRQDGSCFISPT